MTTRHSSRRKLDLHTLTRRTIHARGADLRAGLADLRAQVDPKHYSAIIADLSTRSIYKPILACEPFPATFDALRRRKRLYAVDAPREFLWTANVLALFKDRLREFVARRMGFEQALLEGQFSLAQTALVEIERSHGVSIWVSAAKLQLLQLTSGLKTQKDYLESIIAAKNLDPFVAWMIFLSSYRAEENISLASIKSEFEDLLQSPGLGNYLKYHFIGFDLTEIDSPASVIEWEEAHPMIDRLQAFISMATVEFARNGARAIPYLQPSLEKIKEVADGRVATLLAVMNGRLNPSSSDCFDRYTEGNYSSLSDCTTPLELLARAELLDPSFRNKFNPGSLASEAISSMKEVLTASEQYTQATNRLQKLALIGNKADWTAELIAFLNRRHGYTIADAHSGIDTFAALNGRPLNPWHVSIYASLASDSTLTQQAWHLHPSSSAFLLRRSLALPVAEADQLIESIPMPQYRRSLYGGHVRLRNNDLLGAIDHYGAARESDNEYLVVSASPHLYDALFSLGNRERAVDLVIDHCLKNAGAHRLYPLEKLATTIQSSGDRIAYVPLCILLHLAARHVNPRWERDLSDAYENVLFRARVRTPLEFARSPEGAKLEGRRLIYFLRYVCVPRILDDSTSFTSVSDVEQERIAICQLLAELDELNRDTYASEIRAITRDAQVAHLLKQVEASKIYVDEEGIRSSIQDSMQAAFARYQALNQSPSLEYQAVQITKRLKELVGEKGASELRHFRLPSSEKEALFTEMLSDFVEQFALNPAYGLNIHLSTSIRHGAFEGHLRANFLAESLLCTYDSINERHTIPSTWASIAGDSDEHQAQVDKHLIRLTSKVDEVVEHWLKEVLRIRSTSSSQDGRFDFAATDSEVRELMDGITSSTTYEEFVDRLFAHCWRKLDSSMANIRAELLDPLLTSIMSAIDTLIAGTESSIGHGKAKRLIDSAVRAKTNVHGSVMTISEWFKRPSDLQRSPFDFELAVAVATKQIENCYVRSRLRLNVSVSVPFRIVGSFLDGIVEILFILLQNVIRHGGGRDGEEQLVSVDVRHGDSSLFLAVENLLPADLDLAERRSSAAEAEARYEHDTAMRMAGREGGSGLSKIWRILQFDLGRTHTLSILVGDDRRFRVAIRINEEGMQAC